MLRRLRRQGALRRRASPQSAGRARPPHARSASGRARGTLWRRQRRVAGRRQQGGWAGLETVTLAPAFRANVGREIKPGLSGSGAQRRLGHPPTNPAPPAPHSLQQRPQRAVAAQQAWPRRPAQTAAGPGVHAALILIHTSISDRALRRGGARHPHALARFRHRRVRRRRPLRTWMAAPWEQTLPTVPPQSRRSRSRRTWLMVAWTALSRSLSPGHCRFRRTLPCARTLATRPSPKGHRRTQTLLSLARQSGVLLYQMKAPLRRRPGLKRVEWRGPWVALLAPQRRSLGPERMHG